MSGLVEELRGLAKAHALGSAFFDKENARACSSAADTLEAQARELAEALGCAQLMAAGWENEKALLATAQTRIVALKDAVRVKDEALEPFARVDTKDRADDERVMIEVSATREEAEALNRSVDERGLPIKKAGTDPFAPDAGLNWPSIILDIDGILISAFRRARTALSNGEPKCL